jgi:Flp pilus assembly protein TadG
MMRGARPSVGTRATAAIEFALLAPMLLILLAGMVEVGTAVYQGLEVQAAASAGGRYATQHGWGNINAISQAVVNATSLSGVTASPAPQVFCGCPTTTGITSSACSTTCTGGTAPGYYVQVNAAVAHTTILPFLGLPLPAVITGQSTVRVQ